jgi:Flp pilus assembly protein TadG
MVRAQGLLRRLTVDRRGGVAVMFALAILPLVGAVGLALDFGMVMAARTKAQMAADAAALYAAGVARDLVKASDGSQAATDAAILEAKARGAALFKAHADQAGISSATVQINVARSGQTLTASAAYSIVSPNHLGRVFNKPNFTANGSAQSNGSLPAYSDVYLALDISQSMGIASTKAGMTTLYNANVTKTNGSKVKTTCVFGCHTVEDGYAESYRAVAKRANVQLRIDVLRDATKKMISTAQNDAEAAPIYRLALYAMGMSTDYKSARLIPLAALSNDYTGLTTAADQIDLGPAPGNGSSDSYLNENLSSVNDLVPASADGSAQNKSKKYAFIITDGVRDIQGSTSCVKTGNRCVSAISQTSCDALKRKGVTVGVLYTTYEPITPYTGTDWYKVQVVDTGVAAASPPALKGCASPGWFFEASDAASIDAALQKMFAQTSYPPSLTD